jgi:hypothetical protein
MSLWSNFWALPHELQLAVIENLPLNEYVNFALAAYMNLRMVYPDYFPAVTRSRLRQIRTGPAPGRVDPLQALPNEMILNIARYIDRRYLLGWVFAHYHTLANSNPPLVPPLTSVNMEQLFAVWIRLDGMR